MADARNNANVQQAVPFFMVANMPASLRFYTEGLGFELTNKWEPRGHIEWCWLQLGGAAIMLQSYRTGPPQETSGIGTCIYFQCEDALKIYHEVLSRELAPAEPFVGNQMWVVGIRDPDGYQLFFTSITDVLEETMYSDWIKQQI